MPRVHFLNVRNGDCSLIQHSSGRNTVIDINSAFVPSIALSSQHYSKKAMAESWQPVTGHFDQKSHPDNPIEYLQKFGITSIFRFILTHPDMDHLGGFRDLFTQFSPGNIWDTANTKEFEEDEFEGRPKLRQDWDFYKALRDSDPDTNPRRLVYYSGAANRYYKKDGWTILAPTPELVEDGNRRKKWNDASYVLLYRSCNRKIVFSGDSEDKTWKHILKTWHDEVSNLDVLIAPHHGRDSGRNYDFLDVTRPKLTLFGAANWKHLAYAPWTTRGLLKITNNQAGYIVLDIDNSGLAVYCKHEPFAKSFCEKNGRKTRYEKSADAWFLGKYRS